jgi:hypothetical protein
MPLRFWVHRLTSNDGGNPKGSIDASSVEHSLLKVAKDVLRAKPEVLEYDAVAEQRFLSSELIDHGRLRQGWGVPGLSLKRETDFLNNFVIAMRRYWNSIPEDLLTALRARDVWDDTADLMVLFNGSYRRAAGRFAILFRMIQMNRGDLVFVPNVPKPGHSFAVCRIVGASYEFEERTGPAIRTWERDFGHLRQVTDVRVFDYGPKTLPTGAFGTPYRHAIDRGSARVEEFEKFAKRLYS